MICASQICPINATIAAMNAKIANDETQHGFKFSPVMSFGLSCKICPRTRYWLRLADGSVREQKSADAA